MRPTLSNDDALQLTEFGDDQGAGIFHVVGIADVEDVAAAVEIADGGGKFRAWRTLAAWAAGLGWFALRLHCFKPVS